MQDDIWHWSVPVLLRKWVSTGTRSIFSPSLLPRFQFQQSPQIISLHFLPLTIDAWHGNGAEVRLKLPKTVVINGCSCFSQSRLNLCGTNTTNAVKLKYSSLLSWIGYIFPADFTPAFHSINQVWPDHFRNALCLCVTLSANWSML